jgi:hypothetical protein
MFSVIASVQGVNLKKRIDYNKQDYLKCPSADSGIVTILTRRACRNVLNETPS